MSILWTWILGLKTKLLALGAGILALGAAFIAVYFKGKSKAKAEVKIEAAEEIIEDMEMIKNVQKTVNAVSDSDLDERMHDKGWLRK